MEHDFIKRNSRGVIYNTTIPKRISGILAKYLSTSQGRQSIAAAMAAPIRRSLDYQGFARRALVIDQLPQNDLSSYDKDIDVSAIILNDDKCQFTHGFIKIRSDGKICNKATYQPVRKSLPYQGIARRAISKNFSEFIHDEIVISSNGKVGQRKQLSFPTFEIIESPTFKLSDFKKRRFVPIVGKNET